MVQARVFIPRAAPGFLSLIGYSDDVVKRHYVGLVQARVFIPRAAPGFLSLIGYSDDVVKRHYVGLGLFGVASDSGYVFFYHNLD